MSSPGRFFTMTGVPTSAPPTGYKLPDVMIDLNTSKAYQYSASKWTEQVDFFSKKKGINSCTINSSGNLIITYSDGSSQDVGHVVGDKGDPGTGNGTSVTFQCVTPNQFYTNDWGVAVQKAIDTACASRIPLYTSGIYDCGATVLNFPLFFDEIMWVGNRAKIICGGFTRTRPTNGTDSAKQQNTKYNIYDLFIAGHGTGIGFQPAANSNSVFQNLTIESFDTAGIFRTTQHGFFNQISMNDCLNGLFYDCETNGDLQAAATQSNDNKLMLPRFHSNKNCGITISVKGSFGFECWGLETEGTGTILNPIVVDDLGNGTVKGFNFYKPHFEHRGGLQTNGAFAKVKLNQGQFFMSDPNHDVGDLLPEMCMVDATACAAGSEIILQDVNKWLYKAGNKIFKGGQTHWRFDRGAAIIQFSPNNNPTVEANIKALFAAPVPAFAGDSYNNDRKVWGTNTFDWNMF
jgi:hypothetical protein